MTLFDELIYETSVRMFDPGMIVVPYTASGRDGLRCCYRGAARNAARKQSAMRKPIDSIATTEHHLRKLRKEPVVIAITRAVCAHSLYSEMMSPTLPVRPRHAGTPRLQACP
jgi:hypothetical protein